MSYNHLHVTRGEAGQFQSHIHNYDHLPNHPYWAEKCAEEIRLLSDVVQNDRQVDILIDMTGDGWNFQQSYGFFRRVRQAALRLTTEERAALTAEDMYDFAKEAVPQ